VPLGRIAVILCVPVPEVRHNVDPIGNTVPDATKAALIWTSRIVLAGHAIVIGVGVTTGVGVGITIGVGVTIRVGVDVGPTGGAAVGGSIVLRIFLLWSVS
jgi:hypothetical protein